MATNPEAERRRLVELYSRMTEGELEKLGRAEPTLTDIANEVLRSELSRRGMVVEASECRRIEPDRPNVVTLRRFRDLPEALLAKSILDSAGIICFLADENMIRMDWLWSNALGGIRLLVRQEDTSSAAELLDQKLPQNFPIEDLGEFVQPQCPRCHSTDITYGERGRRLAYVTVFLGVPLPVERSGWKCNSCGHQWDETEEESSKSQ